MDPPGVGDTTEEGREDTRVIVGACPTTVTDY